MSYEHLINIRRNLKDKAPTDSEINEAENILRIIKESANYQVAAERLGLTTKQRHRDQDFNRQVKALKERCEAIVSHIDRSDKPLTGLAARIKARKRLK